MKPFFLYRVRRDFIWINAGAKTTHEPLDATLVARSDDVVIDGDVLLPELHFVGHVREQTTNSGGHVQYVGRCDLLEEG